jgi:hypothetical protein
MNAKQELIEHIAGRLVKFVSLHRFREGPVIQGTLEQVLSLLDWDYDAGLGTQELFGTIWYADGTWSERGEYDGGEWWEHRKCPELPANIKTLED